ncbi:MAG: M67 family metallopeptidase [Sphingobium sp.]
MNIRISSPVFARIVALAAKSPAEEICGLLLANDGSPWDRIDSILPAANVAPDPARFFEIDPQTLIRAHRAQRSGGPRIIGSYHSHPGGNPSPSAQDARQAASDGALWLIVAGPPWTATLWRAVQGGAVHGRFDPVALRIESRATPDP